MQTNYRFASITKQFTAAFVSLLMEGGKLRLEDRCSRALRGSPDYEDFVPEGTAQVHDAGVLRICEKEHRAHFTAGTGCRYGNRGRSLLALVVEKESSQRFTTFLRERVFQPLGVNRTVEFVR